MRWAALLALAVLAGCGSAPRLVAPLRYEASAAAPDEAFRRTPPAPQAAETVPVCPAQSTDRLSTGMRVVVAERHAFPTVAARLVFSSDRLGWTDSDARLEVMGAVFLSTMDPNADGRTTCSALGCISGMAGTREQMDELLARLAALVGKQGSVPGAREQRLAQATRIFQTSGNYSTTALWRNAFAAAFGAPLDSGTRRSRFRLEDLQGLRDALIHPENATLVIAGDVTTEAALTAARHHFGGWVGPRTARGDGAPRRPFADGPGVVVVDHDELTETLGALVARGPAREDQDAAAMTVIAQMLGGGLTSAAYHSVRDEMSAGYAIGGEIMWWRGASLFSLVGQFDPRKTAGALDALLRSMRGLRDAAKADADIARAKAGLRAQLRQQIASNAAVAAGISVAVVSGGPLDICDFGARVDAVTAADVRRVAETYFAESRLHAVAVGPIASLARSLDALRLGPQKLRDGFGHDVTIAAE